MIEPEGEAETGSDADHYSVAEAMKFISELDAAEWARLRALARNRCRGRFQGQEEDALHEAIVRIASGGRRWRRKVPFEAFVAGVIRSIVSKWSNCVPPTERNLECHGGFEDVLEKQVLEQYRARFANDVDALMLVEGWIEGAPREDVLELLDGDEKRYDAARKRIRRALAQWPELKEMIHGE